MRRAPGVAFDPGREEEELRAYLGEDYDHARLQRYEQQLDEEYERAGDEGRFYRTSRAYVYNLTAFAMTGTKIPYLRDLTRHLPRGSRILDYGCGIGSDGLMLLEAGYRVEFADFDNPSLAYLRWRLGRRGVEAPIHDLDVAVPGGFDAAYAFDVIEHVPNPFAFLGELERRARLIAVNLLEPKPDESPLHRELPIGGLLDHVADRRLVFYRIHHRSSHLVLYAPEMAGRGGKVAARAKLALGAVRRSAGGRLRSSPAGPHSPVQRR